MHWVDQAGNPATSFWTTLEQSDAVPGGLVSLGAAAQALSVAGLVAIQYQTTAIIGATGGAGDYNNINDRATFLARITDTNRPSRFEIPAPKLSIFQSDHVTVDLSNADVITLQSALEAETGDTSGHATGPFVRGTRSRARGG